MAILKFRSCSYSNWNSGSKDANTVYFVENYRRLYVGSRFMANATVYSASFALIAEGGGVDFSLYTIKYRTSTSTSFSNLSLTSDGLALISYYTPRTWYVVFPEIPGYCRVKDRTVVGQLNINALVIKYKKLTGQVRSVVLERSNPELWYTSGSEGIVNYFINQPVYVIDEIHKTYAKLLDSTFTKFEDNTAYSGTYGNVFKYIPKVYYKMTTNSDSEPVLQISQSEIPGGHYWDESWIGVYKGFIDSSNSLRSLPDKIISPNTTYTAQTLFDNAQTLTTSSGVSTGLTLYGLVNYYDHCKLRALFLAKFGNPSRLDITSMFYHTGNYAFNTGVAKSIGNRSLEKYPYTLVPNNTYYVDVLFGIEGLCTDMPEFIPNIINFYGPNLYYYYEGNELNWNPSTYRTTSFAGPYSGYIQGMVLGEYCDFMPLTVTGTSSTYYTQYSFGGYNKGVTFGGNSGLFYTYYGFMDNSAQTMSTRLAFRGDISEYTLVKGSVMKNANT